MKLIGVCYDDLNPRQRRIYNFHKVACLLADYGYDCIKSPDDRKGIEFQAHHIDGHTLAVQLKSRMLIDRNYVGKDLYLCFPAKCIWYLVPYDKLIRIVEDEKPGTFKTRSWERGLYSWPRPPGPVIERLAEYRLGPAPCIG